MNKELLPIEMLQQIECYIDFEERVLFSEEFNLIENALKDYGRLKEENYEQYEKICTLRNTFSDCNKNLKAFYLILDKQLSHHDLAQIESFDNVEEYNEFHSFETLTKDEYETLKYAVKRYKEKKEKDNE